MEPTSLGKILILLGLVLIAAGAIAIAGPHLPFGRLPGDFHWKKGGLDVCVPFTTCVFVSVLLTLIFRLFRR